MSATQRYRVRPYRMETQEVADLYGVSTLAEFYLRPDSCTAAGRIPIRFSWRLLGLSSARQWYKVRPYRMKTQEVTVFCRGSLR